MFPLTDFRPPSNFAPLSVTLRAVQNLGCWLATRFAASRLALASWPVSHCDRCQTLLACLDARTHGRFPLLLVPWLHNAAYCPTALLPWRRASGTACYLYLHNVLLPSHLSRLSEQVSATTLCVHRLSSCQSRSPCSPPFFPHPVPGLSLLLFSIEPLLTP